jgi:hypothetical protein
MHQRSSLGWLSALVVLFLLGSCAPVTQDAPATPANLTGYWKSTYGDGFEVSGTSFRQYNDAAKVVSFAGDIVNAPNMSQANGFLTVKITDSGSFGMTKEKFVVVRWKLLSSKGVLESTPYKNASSFNSGADSTALAESEFTDANGYFGYYGEYARQ